VAYRGPGQTPPNAYQQIAILQRLVVTNGYVYLMGGISGGSFIAPIGSLRSFAGLRVGERRTVKSASATMLAAHT